MPDAQGFKTPKEMTEIATHLALLAELYEAAEQRGCDHIIGYDDQYDEPTLVYVSDLTSKVKIRGYAGDMNRFEYCPICSEHISEESDFG